MATASTTEWNLRKRQRRTLRDLRALLRENVMRGSVVETTRVCGKATCVCARDKTRRHPRRMLSVNLGGRSRTAHLDDAHLVSVQRATSNYRRLWRRLEELTEINLKLLAFPVSGDDA